MEEIEREVSEEDMSSADSAGGSLSCRVFRWFGAFPRPIAKRLIKTCEDHQTFFKEPP